MKRPRIRRVLGLGAGLLAMLALAAACQEAEKAAPTATATPQARTFTDDLDRTVAIPKAPARTVALSPSVVELLYAIGAPPAARPSSADYPEVAKALPSVGTSYNPNLEAIVSLGPDLIVADAQIHRDLIGQLEGLGQPVYAVRVLTFDDVPRNLRRLGEITGHTAEAEKAAAGLEDKLKTIAAKLPSRGPSVFIMVGTATDFSAAKASSWAGDIAQRLRAVNIAAGSPDIGRFPGFGAFSLEQVVTQDPDIIIAISAGPPGAPPISKAMADNPLWKGLKAVKTGRVYEADPVTYVQVAGPRVGEVIDELAAILYPDLFPGRR